MSAPDCFLLSLFLFSFIISFLSYTTRLSRTLVYLGPLRQSSLSLFFIFFLTLTHTCNGFIRTLTVPVPFFLCSSSYPCIAPGGKASRGRGKNQAWCLCC